MKKRINHKYTNFIFITNDKQLYYNNQFHIEILIIFYCLYICLAQTRDSYGNYLKNASFPLS